MTVPEEKVRRRRCGAYYNMQGEPWLVCWRRYPHKGPHVNREKTRRWY